MALGGYDIVLPSSPMLLSSALVTAGGLLLLTGAFRSRSEVRLANRLALVRGEQNIASLQVTPAYDGYVDIAHLPRRGLNEAEMRAAITVLQSLTSSPRTALLVFLISRMVAALVGALGAGYFASSSQPIFMLAISGFGAVAGWLFPVFLLRRHLKRNRTALAKGLPDAFDLLAVCVDAGLALESALNRVAVELRHSHPVVAAELLTTWAEINILPSRDQALQNLADRVTLPSVRAVVGTLIQTFRYGTPLAQALRVASAELRNEQLAALEERASKLPAMLTLPVMLLIMPTIFLIVGGPAILRVMDLLAANAGAK